ncbi:MAG: hypothetical protein KKF98_16715 [Bacteroidetes bacterium]|nr:hypothetical protein [Bacteroidota bacterium]
MEMLLVGATISDHLVFTMAFVEDADNPEKPQTRLGIEIRNEALKLLGFPESESQEPFL